jgi:hypothetical protein
MWMGVAVLILAVGGSALSGCADSPPPPSSVQSFCGGLCTGVARCYPGSSRSVCDRNCIGDPVNEDLTSIRREVAAVVGACLAEESCTTIINGPFDACWDRARAEVAPTTHLLEFCPGYATSAFECGYWFPVEECRNALNIWTDDFLDGLAACTQQTTCDAEDACLDRRFGNN